MSVFKGSTVWPHPTETDAQPSPLTLYKRIKPLRPAVSHLQSRWLLQCTPER